MCGHPNLVCNFFYVTNRTFQKSIFLVKSPLDISAADEDRDHIEQAVWRLEARIEGGRNP